MEPAVSAPPAPSPFASDLGRLPALPVVEPGLANAANFADFVAHHARQTPRKVAFAFCGDGESVTQEITYAELQQRSASIACELLERKLAGQRALLLYPPGIEFITALVACWQAGVIAVPAFPPHRNRHARRVASILVDARPAAALTTSESQSTVAQICNSERKRSIEVIATDDIRSTVSISSIGLPLATSQLALLQYTSGSTGAPKGVCISHANLLANARTIAESFETDSRINCVFWLPTYHDMGLVGGVVVPLLLGGTNTLLPATQFLQQPMRWLELISRIGADVSGGPNFAYDLCVAKAAEAELEGLDLSSWRVAFNGAEPVRAETLDRFSETFAKCGFRRQAFYPCYGMAEATLLLSGGDTHRSPQILRRSDGATPNVSCGRPRGVDELLIVDPEAQCPVAEGKVGEIWVRGTAIANGYWNKEIGAETFQARIKGRTESFLRTGDLGFLERGELYVTGRAKELLILRGVNYHPHDIEQTSRSAHGDLRHAPAAALAVDVQGQEELVVIQESPTRHVAAGDAIVAAIREAVATEHGVAPMAVMLVKPGQLPRTSSGKIQRFACRETFCEDGFVTIAEWRREAIGEAATSTDAYESPTLELLIASVRQIAGNNLGPIDHQTRITALALDSLESMEVLTAIENRFGLHITEHELAGCDAFGDLVSLLEEAYQAGTTPREIAAGDWQFTESPEYHSLQTSLQMTDRAGVPNPFFVAHDGVARDRTKIGGREYINFCSYNYLGMNGHPAVTEAAKLALEQYGSSVSASRLVAGERPLHRQLEKAIAKFLNVEDAITFVGGHSTNETVIGHMFGPGDLVLHDALAHNSIVQGCRLSGAQRRAFPHNDAEACNKILATVRHRYRRVLIAIEGVYSMDGDIAPLPDFIDIKQRHRAYLIVDEAHSLGTIGLTGRGIGEHFAVEPQSVDLWMGTLSKSLASCGGYIAASRAIVEYLRYTAPGFVYSVGLSPPNAAAALAALKQMQKTVGNVMLLRENARRFVEGVRRIGLNCGLSSETPIVPVIVGNSISALHLSDRLFRDGINVQPILAPAVDEQAARLRFFITSQHTADQIDQTLELLAKHSRDLPRG